MGHEMNKRQFLKGSAATGLGSIAVPVLAQTGLADTSSSSVVPSHLQNTQTGEFSTQSWENQNRIDTGGYFIERVSLPSKGLTIVGNALVPKAAGKKPAVVVIGPVAYIKEHHDRITNLHLKDRKKNHGPNMPWGQGDTNIKGVLQLLKKEKYGFPANVEYEYMGKDDAVTEVARCVEFCKAALG